MWQLSKIIYGALCFRQERGSSFKEENCRWFDVGLIAEDEEPEKDVDAAAGRPVTTPRTTGTREGAGLVPGKSWNPGREAS